MEKRFVITVRENSFKLQDISCLAENEKEAIKECTRCYEEYIKAGYIKSYKFLKIRREGK